MNREPVELRVRPETTTDLDQVRQGLARADLVDRRPDRGARERYPGRILRDKDQVALLEDDIAPGLTLEEVVVKIQRRNDLALPPDLNFPEITAVVGATGGVQRVQDRGDRGKLIRPRLHRLAGD